MTARPRWRTATAAGVALVMGLVLTGCSAAADENGPAAPDLTVDGAFMPQPVSDTAAGFLTIRNGGSAADRLTSITSPLSDDVTMHESKDQRMRKVDGFDVPADGTLALERGGNHLMFMKIKKRPVRGETVTVELRFETSDPLRVELPVKEATYNPATASPTESGPGSGETGHSGH
ncbi:copper chaperone PCu(A)C [Streptomyces sp. NPDC057638]|uniref:copper chaperone PCu(A)C n=1 Tax=Streptomyces sp. NPDC057638 TaxID=3346190 RepID=UPI0036968C50